MLGGYDRLLRRLLHLFCIYFYFSVPISRKEDIICIKSTPESLSWERGAGSLEVIFSVNNTININCGCQN